MQQEALLIRGGRVLDAGGDLDQPPVCDLLIRDGVIVAVGEAVGEALAAAGGALAAAGGALDKPGGALTSPGGAFKTAAARVIDASGMLVIPGLLNMHYHSHDVLARGMFEDLSLEHWGVLAGPLGAKRSLAEVRARTLVGAIECLRNGITTVQDMSSFSPMSDEVLDTIVDAYAEAGIRVVFGITVRDRSQLETTPYLAERLPAELQSVIGTGRDDPAVQMAFVERQIGRIGTRGGLLRWALAPSAPQRCSPGLLESVADLSRRLALPVYTHVYETRMQRVFALEQLQAWGGSAVKLMQATGLLGPHVTIAHGIWPDEAELDLIGASGTHVVLNMLSNLKLKSGVAPMLGYRARGVNIALGCDNCSCSDVQSLFQVMKLYCLLAAVSSPEATGVTAAEAFIAATRGGARSAGLAGVIGELKVGQRADLSLLDLSDPAWVPYNSAVRQLVYSESGRSVHTVIVDGRVVVEAGRAVTVDEAALRDEVASLMPQVRQDIDRLRAGHAQVRGHIDAAQKFARDVPLPMHRFVGPQSR